MNAALDAALYRIEQAKDLESAGRLQAAYDAYMVSDGRPALLRTVCVFFFNVFLPTV